jgi:putative tryptophan/tyrosine transport system substrate-binding protein
MRRREFIITLFGGAAVGWPLAARAQRQRMPVIGWTGFQYNSPVDGLLKGLHELDYVEGKNIAVLYRLLKTGDVEFTAAITELAQRNVDIIATAGFPATLAAHRAALAIPVVYVVADPVGAGFAASLAHPGGNMTGLSLAVEEQFAGKWLELLKETSPQVARVGFIWNPANHSSASSLAAMQALAPKLGLSIHSVELRDTRGVDNALAAVAHEQAEGLIIDSDAVMGQVQAPIVAFARAHRLPLISAFRRVVEAGGLMSYGPNLHELWRQAARYIDKILKGAKPADLPVEQPTAFELVINLKTAKALGLTVPATLLSTADEVIE